MRPIIPSKESTPRKMLLMAGNLREKYNCHASISLIANAYGHLPPTDTLSEYSIYIAMSPKAICMFYNSWKECFAAYKEYMND
jgi:hypothetical protein